MTKPGAIQPVGASTKICACIYSDPGAGKTSLAAKTQMKTLIVAPPLDHRDSVIGQTGAEEWIVHTWEDMVEVQEYMIHEGHKSYDWLWLDSASLWFDQGLHNIWAGVIAEKPHRWKYGPDKGEYGINMWRLAEWLRIMVGTPGFNFGVTAHPFLTDTVDGEVKLAPYLQGKNMATKLCGYMNVVGFLEVKTKEEETYRLLSLNSTGRFYAKDQFNAYPSGRVKNPNIDALTKAWSKNLKGAKTRPVRRRTRREQ